MASKCIKTVAVVTGIAAVIVGVAVSLYWQQIYNALYPETQLWGRWVANDRWRPFIELPWRKRGDANPVVANAKIASVEFHRHGGLSVEVFATLYARPGPPPTDGPFITWTFDLADNECHFSRNKLTFPNLPVLLDDFEKGRLHHSTAPPEDPPRIVTLHYRLYAEGSLALEAEQGFFEEGSGATYLYRSGVPSH